MRIDVWSDIACPWCWLGKRNLEEAIRRAGRDDVEITMRSFELNPRAGPTRPAKEYLAERFGSAARVDEVHRRLEAMGERVGLRYDFARQRIANTFDAHRVHQLAKTRGVGGPVVDRFMQAYHGEGEDLADRATIRRLALEAGLEAADVDDVLSSDAYGDAVRADEALAAELGIRGVPFFVLDGRYAISGAQPVEAFAQALTSRSPTSP